MNFSRPGAIDLSALAARAQAPATQDPEGVYVVDVTEENFQALVESTMTQLVVLSVWSSRSPQSAKFNAVLSKATTEYQGALQVARVDVDSQPNIAQALQVQSVPVVMGLVQGRPVPLFQGVVPAEEVKRYFGELVRLAQENGLTGRVAPTGAAPEEEPEPAADPRFAAADEAYAAGDVATAIAEYEKLKVQYPADAEIAERLAGVKLFSRTANADLNQARANAADNPDDVDAQLLVADLDINGGHIEDAFLRLVDLLKRTDEKDRVRDHLLELFVVVGISDPRVATARRSLAAALF